jgi:hypothetical protein
VQQRFRQRCHCRQAQVQVLVLPERVRPSSVWLWHWHCQQAQVRVHLAHPHLHHLRLAPLVLDPGWVRVRPCQLALAQAPARVQVPCLRAKALVRHDCRLR